MRVPQDRDGRFSTALFERYQRSEKALLSALVEMYVQGVLSDVGREGSEAQFKTLKYHPGFPGRFHDITAAIAFCRTFFPWYNTEHRHGGIAMLTPDDVHHNRTQSVLEQRGRTLQAAWTRHPERFVRGIPQPDPLPQAVWINPPVTPTTGETAQ